MKRLLPFFALLLFMPLASAAPPKSLEKFENCTLVPTEWADGDSFRIKTATGEEYTIRLYGVDCIELHGTSETILRRLREQRSYFGITEAGGGSKASIKLARSYAAAARDHTASRLAKPFTVHTRFLDAMGDKRFKRIYGIVPVRMARILPRHLSAPALPALGVMIRINRMAERPSKAPPCLGIWNFSPPSRAWASGPERIGTGFSQNAKAHAASNDSGGHSQIGQSRGIEFTKFYFRTTSRASDLTHPDEKREVNIEHRTPNIERRRKRTGLQAPGPSGIAPLSA